MIMSISPRGLRKFRQTKVKPLAHKYSQAIVSVSVPMVEDVLSTTGRQIPFFVYDRF